MVRTMTKQAKTYEELITLSTFDERLKYLRLQSNVAEQTFAGHRWVNQRFYKSPRWLKIRDEVICRDNGYDLGVDGYLITGRLLIHHIEPITLDDILSENDKIYDLNNLITVGHETHNAIHYGTEPMVPSGLIVRKPGDTCPWR